MIKAITLSFFMLFSISVFACSCMDIPSIKSGFKLSHEVFVGKFLSKEKVSDESGAYTHYVCTFEIETSWKGQETGYIEISTALSSAACGYEFMENEYYLVYASRFNESSPLRTNICTRTNLRRNVEKELITIASKSREWKIEQEYEYEEEETSYTSGVKGEESSKTEQIEQGSPNIFVRYVFYVLFSINHFVF